MERSNIFPFLDLPLEIRNIIYGFCCDLNHAIAKSSRIRRKHLTNRYPETTAFPEIRRTSNTQMIRIHNYIRMPYLTSSLARERTTPKVLLLNRQIQEEAWTQLQQRPLRIKHHEINIDNYYFVRHAISQTTWARIRHLDITVISNLSEELKGFFCFLSDTYRIEGPTDLLININAERKQSQPDDGMFVSSSGQGMPGLAIPSPAQQDLTLAEVIKPLTQFGRISLSFEQASDVYGFGVGWSPLCGGGRHEFDPQLCNIDCFDVGHF